MDSTIPFQLIKTPNKKSILQNVALAPKSMDNNATSSSKAAELLLHTNSTFDLPIGGKTYPITYNITGNDNKLKNITAQKISLLTRNMLL